MKHGMKTKASSTFLASMKRRRNNRRSETRGIVRGYNKYPSSVKVGAGEVTARRSLPNQILHKRNHRSPVLVSGKQ